MKLTLMILRLAFVIALLVGLGDLFGVYHPGPVLRDVHIVAGLIFFASILGVAATGRSPMAWVAAALVFIGGLWALMVSTVGPSLGLVHLVLMVIAIGLVESSANRTRRASGRKTT